MNTWLDWMFWQFWEYTKLTFRIFGWLFAVIAALTAWFLNRRQNRITPEQADLFDQDKQA